MGIDDVATYEASWKQWGKPANFYPVETAEHTFTDGRMPGTSSSVSTTSQSAGTSSVQPTPSSRGSAPKGGYVSCGG